MKISAILAIATTTLVALATADQTAPNNTTSSKCIVGCPKIIKPVCGSDGVTYDNECLFDAAKCLSGDNTLSVKHDGECNAAAKCNVGCPKNYKPVCGSDGVTYGNECEFEAAKCVGGASTSSLVVKHDGECKAAAKCNVGCPKIYKPVCGSDGATYGNECELEAAKCVGGASTSSLVVKHDGECKAAAKCNVGCPKIYKPVCGSDGATYGNECELEAAKCVGGASTSSLVVKHDGECKAAAKCNVGCPKIYKPVCGSDGVTYGNECEFEAAKCVGGASTSSLVVKHDGECKAAAKCNVGCPKIYKPVCGSDGVTYGNECEFEAAKCVGGASTSSLVVKHDGECKAAAKCNVGCPKIYKPVCGSDGVTYGNECEFEAVKCVGGASTSGLVVKHDGVCK